LPEAKSNNFFATMANIEVKKDDYKDNESADCNLTRSDRPSLMVMGLGELVDK
jgi:hypothetical protein